MKNLSILLTIAFIGISLTGCEYDDNALWGEIEQVKNRVTALEESVKNSNNNIAALAAIIETLEKNIYVTNVDNTENGYTITFSNGEKAVISNGKDGSNAPEISIEQDSDGNYYWTLDGDWLLVDNEKVRANGSNGENGKDGENGKNGENGKDAIAPQIRINELSKEWEISTNGGKSWNSTGVIAEGKNIVSDSNGVISNEQLFKSVDLSNKDFVVITLSNNTQFSLARYDNTKPLFIIEGATEIAQIEYGKSYEFSVNAQNIADYTINTPEGWRAYYANGILTITAPAKDLCHFDKNGTIAITVVSEEGKSAIVKQNVITGEWVEEIEYRTLTFEDEDTRFEPYECEFYYAMKWDGDPYEWKNVEKWSDYIPTDGQYGYGHGAYEWYDYNNTELAFIKPEIESWWGISGHAGISNFVGNDYENEGNYMFDLQAYNVDGGANGSSNFCTQYGYLDPEEYATSYSPQGVLPGIQFHDGVARVIDNMYVTNTTYAYNVLISGECDFGGSYEYTDNSTFKIVAYGYETMNDTEPTIAEFYLLNTNKRIVTDWTKWDLSTLGKVVKVEFNLVACDNGYGIYGNVLPAYFAYDDVTVRFNSQLVFK